MLHVKVSQAVSPVIKKALWPKVSRAISPVINKALWPEVSQAISPVVKKVMFPAVTVIKKAVVRTIRQCRVPVSLHCQQQLGVCVSSVCSIDAVYKVQDFLHQKHPADALAFLRACRYVQSGYTALRFHCIDTYIELGGWPVLMLFPVIWLANCCVSQHTPVSCLHWVKINCPVASCSVQVHHVFHYVCVLIDCSMRMCGSDSI